MSEIHFAHVSLIHHLRQMEEDARSTDPFRPSADEYVLTSGTSAFSVSPSSSLQSAQTLQRSVGDTGASTFSVSPSPLSSPLHSSLRPPVNHSSTTLPPIDPSTGSSDSDSPLKSALRQPKSPLKPQLSRRVSIEQQSDFKRTPERLSYFNQSVASKSSCSGLDDSANSVRGQRTPTSHRHSLHMRDSVLSKMSSNVNGLRDSFFGVLGRSTTGRDPLELSHNQEFDLAVIDESGGLDENIGQLLKPQVDFSKWSQEGYIVLAFGLVLLLIMSILAMTINDLDGYRIDPGLVFGSLLTLILCACVFVTYHGVQAYQKHPNPLIYYKCVIDSILALRFLMDPLLLDMGVYNPHHEHSCAYLSGLTQFLYLSSDCWYFAQILDLYWSLTNPFMSVKANRRRFKIMVYSAGSFTGLFATMVPSVHGLADGNYCWTRRKTSADPIERNFFRLNRGSWLLFYMWMILFYLSGIAVLLFGIKRLRSGLRDTLQSRREMLRNGALSIMSYTIYWTIVFIWYALSFQTRTTYDQDGNLPPSHMFRAFTFTLSARGGVDYLVWFTINSPSIIRPAWLQFSSDSADKEFSAQLNTALQEELIYFTIEGMTRAIQRAEEELHRVRGRTATQELVLDASDNESDRPSSLEEAATRATGFAGSGRKLLQSVQRNRMLCTITEVIKAGCHRPHDLSFEISHDQRSMHPPLNRRHNPSSASTVATSNGHPAPKLASGTTASIRFTPYKPLAFAKLRQAVDIKAADFMNSFQTSTKPNISEGASGAFMFFSGDKKYIVKSMAEEEARFLCEIADQYTDYLIQHPSSLITKFYGCFKITMYDRRFYFIVMENLFDVMAEGVQIHHRFDMKGSWINRSYKRPQRGAKVKCRHCSMMFRYGAKKKLLQCPNVVGLHEPNVVLKDNDLRTRMRIGTDEGVRLFEQLRADSLFLCHHGIMDYSLLLGVMDIEFVVDQPMKPREHSVLSERTAVNTATNRANQLVVDTASNDSFISSLTSSTGSGISHQPLGMAPSVHSLCHQPENPLNMSRYPSTGGEPRSKGSMRKSTRVFGPGYYYVGIIDILQTWTMQKRLERFWKVHVQQKDGAGLSAIDPVRYQQRFESKLREIISIPKDYFHRQRNQQATMGKFQSIQRLSPVLRAAAAFEDSATAMARARNDSTDTDTSGTSCNATDDGDLEQAGRNPQPILVPFNQRLISRNSTHSQLSLSDFVV